MPIHYALQHGRSDSILHFLCYIAPSARSAIAASFPAGGWEMRPFEYYCGRGYATWRGVMGLLSEEVADVMREER